MKFWRGIFSRPAVERINNPALESWLEKGSGSTVFKPKFVIERQFASRWNATATAAFPNEIGALVRIIERDGAFVAVDFKVIEQEVSPVYFEFTTLGQAQFQMDMATSGRGDQLAEWYGMIHSHPNMTPFMSSTDVSNLWKLAGNKIGFSLICAARQSPEYNYYSVNFAQGGTVPLMIKDIDHNRNDLGGIGNLGDSELEAINTEVAALTRPLANSWRGEGYVFAPSPNRTLDPIADEEETLFPVSILDAELVSTEPIDDQELILITEALELHEMIGYTSPETAYEILLRISEDEGLSSYQTDVLLSALGEYPPDQDEATVQKLIDQFSQSLDDLEI